MTTPAGLQTLPLEALKESAVNTRRHWNDAKLAELTASIGTHGVLTPLLVRPTPAGKGYEIAAGHRRYRAAKAAGLTAVPALVREMTDEAFLELITVDNLQREDVHPLDEAQGYHQLMVRCKQDVARIAERVGRSVTYVYDRLKLLHLTPAAQDLFLRDRITAGHAVLLARLKPDEQTRLIDPAAREGLWEEMRHLRFESVVADDEDVYANLKPVSVRELQTIIDTYVRFDPKAVDPMLFPETAQELKTAEELCDKVVPLTRDHFVHPEAKDGTRTYGPMSWKRADGQEKSKPCEHAVTGVIVVGEGRGEAFKVCIDKQKCDVHWGKERREDKKRATGDPKAQDRWRREQEKQRREEERREREERQWKKATPAILEALAARVQTLPVTGVLADVVVGQCTRHARPGKEKSLVPRGKTADDVLRHAAFLSLAREASSFWNRADFLKRAKAIGLNVLKILEEVAPLAADPTSAPPSGKPARKPAGKKNGSPHA